LVIIGGAVVFFLYRKRNQKPRGGKDSFDATRGGDELDTLLDKRPLNLSRNSRHSTSVPTSAIPEDKLDAEFTRRLADDKNIMMAEFDMVPTRVAKMTFPGVRDF